MWFATSKEEELGNLHYFLAAFSGKIVLGWPKPKWFSSFHSFYFSNDNNPKFPALQTGSHFERYNFFEIKFPLEFWQEKGNPLPHPLVVPEGEDDDGDDERVLKVEDDKDVGGSKKFSA